VLLPLEKTSGGAQGRVLMPLFKSLGFDSLLESIR
jgi:hypothetical protein